MNDLKGIIEDCNKSDLVSDKIIKKIIEIIGQEEWQDLHDENNDICTTMGELIITLKGIAELEQENKVLAQNLEDTEIVNKSLEKENAELNGLVNQYKASKCSGISLVNRNMIMFDQLTNAKELLKRCYENYIYLEPLRSEIKQFISEVKK